MEGVFVRTFNNRKAAEAWIHDNEKHGWRCTHFQVFNKSEGWSFWKTCCLGFIFLPLALLGRKPDSSEYVVTLAKEA
jgi:hypothetical protein